MHGEDNLVLLRQAIVVTRNGADKHLLLPLLLLPAIWSDLADPFPQAIFVLSLLTLITAVNDTCRPLLPLHLILTTMNGVGSLPQYPLLILVKMMATKGLPFLRLTPTTISDRGSLSPETIPTNDVNHDLLQLTLITMKA